MPGVSFERGSPAFDPVIPAAMAVRVQVFAAPSTPSAKHESESTEIVSKRKIFTRIIISPLRFLT
jgi:hypothetical protein